MPRYPPKWGPKKVSKADYIDTEKLRKRHGPLTRRGPLSLQRPTVGETALEQRAVPMSEVYGSLPERIMYKALLDRSVTFDFQCLAGHHEVLTTDLVWKPIAELQVGETLIAVEEKGSKGHWKRKRSEVGTVLACEPAMLDAYRVVLSNGQEFVTTAEHPWLVRFDPSRSYTSPRTNLSWMQTRHLRKGIYVPQLFERWKQDRSWEAGYISGFMDGEGSLIQSRGSNSLTFSQNHGDTLERTLELLKQLGFVFSIYDYNGRYNRSYDEGKRRVVQCRLAGGRSELLRFLGIIRPARFMAKFDANELGTIAVIGHQRIECVEPLGKREIYRLATSSKTYIADGFAMHNSSMLGGRLELGGMVADFILLDRPVIIRVQGGVWHQGIESEARDEEHRAILQNMGYDVFDIWDWEIYDGDILDDWLERHIEKGLV